MHKPVIVEDPAAPEKKYRNINIKKRKNATKCVQQYDWMMFVSHYCASVTLWRSRNALSVVQTRPRSSVDKLVCMRRQRTRRYKPGFFLRLPAWCCYCKTDPVVARKVLSSHPIRRLPSAHTNDNFLLHSYIPRCRLAFWHIHGGL